MRISIRAPARGATTVSVCAEFSGSNFNPRSREGSDAWQKADWLYYQISIRAPARGATGRPCQLLYVKGFQSALPRGERLPLTRGMLQVHDFNPRSREGSDTIWSDIVSRTGISIRAPARGATLHFLRHFRCHVNFNPRSREGSDSINFANCFCDTISIRAPARGATFNSPVNDPVLQFQSALPRGERRSGAIRLNNFFIISIRAPARGATQYQGGANAWIEFQSALPRGERPDISSEIHKAFLISIRAPARGATESANTIAAYNYISIRAPARGATLPHLMGLTGCRGFQSALPRGERRFYTQAQLINGVFQSALPRGERP